MRLGEGAFVDAPGLASDILPGPRGRSWRELISPDVQGVRCLRDHDHTVALESELGDGFVGERLGGNDYMSRALHREMTQAQMNTATAQSLAEAGACAELVDGHDHWTGAVQHRALHPGCVKHVVCLTGSMCLDDLSARGNRVAQRVEQMAGVAPYSAWIGGGPAVEGDPHERLLDSTRLFTGPPGNARKAR
jgi:hypothetical protein